MPEISKLLFKFESKIQINFYANRNILIIPWLWVMAPLRMKTEL